MNTTAASYSSEHSWLTPGHSRRGSIESELSIQGKETDYVRDTSDTDCSSGDKGEYEPVTEAEDDGPLDWDSSGQSDNEIIATKVIEVSVGDDGDLEFADSEQTESEGSDSEIDLYDYWECARCRAANNNPLYRYCEKCFKVRKNFFPPRPRKNKRKRVTDVPRTNSVDSGVESAFNSQESLSQPDTSLASQRTDLTQPSLSQPPDLSQPSTLTQPSLSQPTDLSQLTLTQSSLSQPTDQSQSTITQLSLSQPTDLSQRTLTQSSLSQPTDLSQLTLTQPSLSQQTDLSQPTDSQNDTPLDNEATSSTQRNVILNRPFKRRAESADRNNKRIRIDYSDTDTDSDEPRRRKAKSADPEVAPLIKTISDPALTIDDTVKLSKKAIFNSIKDKLDSDNICIICYAEPKSAVFVHGRIAHICCCYECANKVWRKAKRCPQCNCKVSNVLRVL